MADERFEAANQNRAMGALDHRHITTQSSFTTFLTMLPRPSAGHREGGVHDGVCDGSDT